MNDQIQHKLFNYQPEPPAQIWNKIADALDHNTENNFAQKLYRFQSTPPESVWENIEQQLNKADPEKAPVVSFYQKYRVPLKYASVAASLIFFAVLISLIITKKAKSDEVTSAKVATVKKGKSDPSANETAIYDAANTGQNSKKDNNLPVPQARTKKDTDEQNKWITAMDQSRPMHSSRYVLFAGQAGNEVKVSKKLYGLFACSDEKLNCRQKIETLQQKVASSNAMSSADFTGVLDLLKSLEKNQ